MPTPMAASARVVVSRTGRTNSCRRALGQPLWLQRLQPQHHLPTAAPMAAAVLALTIMAPPERIGCSMDRHQLLLHRSHAHHLHRHRHHRLLRAPWSVLALIVAPSAEYSHPRLAAAVRPREWTASLTALAGASSIRAPRVSVRSFSRSCWQSAHTTSYRRSTRYVSTGSSSLSSLTGQNSNGRRQGLGRP